MWMFRQTECLCHGFSSFSVIVPLCIASKTIILRHSGRKHRLRNWVGEPEKIWITCHVCRVDGKDYCLIFLRKGSIDSDRKMESSAKRHRCRCIRTARICFFCVLFIPFMASDPFAGFHLIFVSLAFWRYPHSNSTQILRRALLSAYCPY